MNKEIKSKFKSQEELEKAYGALEAEFTKRCQRLKELERETESLRADKVDRETLKKQTIAEYLASKTNGVPVMPKGRAAALNPKPKTIEQAGEIAKLYLKEN